MIRLLLAALLLAGSASASAPVNTAGPLDCSTGICTSKLVQMTVQPGSGMFNWGTLTQLFNRGPEPAENVATYSQAWKQSESRTWALVGETKCIEKRGGCHGAEIDLTVDGPLEPGDWRLGQSIVIWQKPGSTEVPTANYGLLIAGGPPHREDVRLNYGVSVEAHCYISCLQVRSGDKIALSDDGKIAMRFNPATGNVELLNGERVLWQVPTQ